MNDGLLARFRRGVWHLPLAGRCWLGGLVLVNGVLPLVFLAHREAQVILGIFVITATSVMMLAGVTGFTRLVGLGQVLWVPLLFYLWSRMGGHPAAEPFGAWIRIVMLLDAASLVMGGCDVVRYVRGERDEIVGE